MDGNGRWAKRHFLPRVAGHRVGLESARRIVKLAFERGVEVLSLFAFSTENWQRPDDEVNQLMALLLMGLKKEAQTIHQRNIRLRIIGDRSHLNSDIIQCIDEVQDLTKDNTAANLVLAINYGGQWDITQAAQRMARAVVAGQLNADAISTQLFSQYVSLADLPPVDFLIRTSGELRISNFFLWQLAYAELYFTPVLWPDFDHKEFDKALAVFSERKRRFGDISVRDK